MDNFKKLLRKCQDIDAAYYESDDPNVGHKLGHYDEDNQEIHFYDVHNKDRVQDLRNELDSVGVPYTLTAEQTLASETFHYVVIKPA